MNKVINSLKTNGIAGVLFLLPVYILIKLVQKAFAFFSKFGNGISKFLGLNEVFGKHAADVFGFIFLLLLVLICGYLVRFSFFKNLSNAIDSKLKEYIPGYEKHKETAEKKLLKEEDNTVIAINHVPVLLKMGDYWQPANLIEKNKQGKAVVFIPNGNNIETGQILIVPIENVQFLENNDLASLNKIIQSKGEGLLNFK